MIASLRWYYPDQVQRVRGAVRAWAALSAAVGSPSFVMPAYTLRFHAVNNKAAQDAPWVFCVAVKAFRLN